MWHLSHVNSVSPIPAPDSGLPPFLSPKAPAGRSALLDISVWGCMGLSFAEVLGGVPLGQYVSMEVDVPGQFLLACCVGRLAHLPLLWSLAVHLGRSGSLTPLPSDLILCSLPPAQRGRLVAGTLAEHRTDRLHPQQLCGTLRLHPG